MSEGKLDTGAMSDNRRGPRLDDALQYVKGVGPRLAEALAKMQCHTVLDLLRHYPRRHDDRTHFARAADAMPGVTVSLRGRVISVNTELKRTGLRLTKALLDDEGCPFLLVWFNQSYMDKRFTSMAQQGRFVVAYGAVRRNNGAPEITNPEWEEIDDSADSLSVSRIVPIYPLTEGIYQRQVRRWVYDLLQSHGDLLTEVLPADVLLEHKLMSRAAAYRNIHFPGSIGERDAARRRLVFEEFFLLQILLAARRRNGAFKDHGIQFRVDAAQFQTSLREVVPFELTGAQKRCITEITKDLCSGRAMNRLLQGDVGCGKTMVALAAILLTVQNNCQAALMAPTEILAQQHAIVLRRLLEPIGIPVELAIGSHTGKFKAAVRERIAGGLARVAVGTHALIQEGVDFAKLGLVIVDEQHRFGVLQRQALMLKGTRPHILVMTATPIPRTLTMTLYGDLDVSIIDEMPPGRKPVTTHLKSLGSRAQVYAGAQRLLAEGRQIYIVCPLVEQSEKLQAKDATQLSEHIARDVFPQYRVGLLHGQMKSDEKDRVMAQFKAHELDVLVATSVIEVGIDVPNACAILIEDADRFGLAQLHQLRGRVGRGEHASFCVLIADPKTEVGRRRLEILTQTRDGFRIAEEDLLIRGPGEFFGTRQSGLPELIIADVIRDFDVLTETREAAFLLIDSDPNLAAPHHMPLRQAVLELQDSTGTICIA